MNNKCFRSEISWGKRMAIFVGLWFASMLLSMILMAIVIGIGGLTVRAVNISIVVQNVVMFALPAMAAAVLLTRAPHDMLCTAKAPSLRFVTLVVLVAAASLPAMNWIVDWNQNLHLPESLQAVEQVIRDAEEQAMDQTRVLLGGTTVFALIVSLLTVGVLTGFGEEIFFRGALLRILQSKPMSAHLAIWITAIIFSAVHLQFLGFVPRMLLGAWFGYLLWWSRSLWVPVIAHALNNSVAVVSSYIYGVNSTDSPLDRIGLDNEWVALASAVATALIIILFARTGRRK